MAPSVSASASTAPCGLEGGGEVSSGSLHSAAAEALRGDASAAAATASRAAAISRAAASRAARPSRDPRALAAVLATAAAAHVAQQRGVTQLRVLATGVVEHAVGLVQRLAQPRHLRRCVQGEMFTGTLGHSLDACGDRRDT